MTDIRTTPNKLWRTLLETGESLEATRKWPEGI